VLPVLLFRVHRVPAGTGYILFDEFCCVVRQKMQDDEDEKELRDMFRILDKEKKGEVNTNELRYYHVTSCARGDTMCLRPLQVDNVFVFIRQVAPGSGMLAI